MSALRGRVAVVTGAGSGIGRALALQLAAAGARLALSDVDGAGLAETARAVAEIAAAPHQQVLDVAERAAVLSYADSVADELGPAQLVINNAGISFTGDVTAMSFEQIERVLDVDFWGVVHGSKAFLPQLIASGDGHLVNVSSVFGLLSVPGQSAYNAAKFAVRGFTESLRQEMLVNRLPVRVTCVHPGGIRTAIARSSGAVAGLDQAALAEFFDRRLARTTPEAAARTILRAVRRNRARVLVGADAHLLDGLVRVAGPAYQRLVARIVRGLPGPARPVGAATGPGWGQAPGRSQAEESAGAVSAASVAEGPATGRAATSA